MLVFACSVETRQHQLISTIREQFGERIWDRVDVMTFEDIQAGRAPGYPYPDETLRPIDQGLFALRDEIER